jgi:hypothetical protein
MKASFGGKIPIEIKSFLERERELAISVTQGNSFHFFLVQKRFLSLCNLYYRKKVEYNLFVHGRKQREREREKEREREREREREGN